MHQLRLDLKLILICLFSVAFAAKTNAQKISGIRGQYYILGYQTDYRYTMGNSNSTKPLSTRLQHRIYLEKILNTRSNIGISFTNSVSHIDFNHFAYNYNLYYRNVSVSVDGNPKYLLKLNGMSRFRTLGYEIYMKNYFIANKFRNYSWFWSYRYGRLYMETSILEGANVDAFDLDKTPWEAINHPYNDNRVYKSKCSYIGIDIGKTYPFHHQNLLFTTSLSYNIFFNDTELDYSFEEYIQYTTGRHVARRHALTWNVGFAYIL